jgi:translation initiation factor 2B subunit (eIF-2B alpha/beta/delta family)
LAEDHRSPSSALAARAAEVLREVASDDPEMLAEAARAVVQAQPSMAAVANVANVALRVVETLGLASVAKALESLQEGIAADLRDAATAIRERVDAPVRVVTTSASAGVVETIQSLRRADMLRDVVCAESRPLLEGTALARWFVEQGIETTLVSDAGLCEQLTPDSIFLVGADAILPQAVVNKLGTRVYATWAQLAGVLRFVVASRDKIFPAELAPLFSNPQRPREELLRDPPAALRVVNRAFDLTPREVWSEIFVGRQPAAVAEGRGDHALARGLLQLVSDSA